VKSDTISARKAPLSGKIYLLFMRFLLAVSRKQNLGGVKIVMLLDKNDSAISSKVNQALNLIS
jgi:hypothetical protein